MKYAVIGLGFGDEGKGLVTDYLCSHSTNPLVVRFSGGHQAGHTVVRKGVKHVFTNFGSGTLLNIPTYWSKYCTVEPVGLVNEYYTLVKKGIVPTLYIDKDCPITTPYDIKANYYTKEHGSCGVGFGKTIERENHHYSLRYSDIFNAKITNIKMKLIDQYYFLDDESVLDQFYEAINEIIYRINIESIDYIPNYYTDYVFEGSQGLLLDQNYGFFPHVTYSNTGMTNIIEMGHIDTNIYLVTRAYQTRHGDGPMTNENIQHSIKDDPNETNVENEFQGKFRKSVLDLNLLLYGMNKDFIIRTSNHLNLVITCLDHVMDSYLYTYNNELVKCNTQKQFVNDISTILNIKNVFISSSPESQKIKRVK